MLQVIPQLMARLDQTGKNLLLTKQVIHELSKRNPQVKFFLDFTDFKEKQSLMRIVFPFQII